MTDLLAHMMTEEEFLAHMGTSDEELEHHGVKGMKWGVIREQAAAGDKGAAKKLAKGDIDWQNSTKGTAAYVAVHNKMAAAMNGAVTEKFNANPKYSSIKDFRNFDDPKVKEYISDYEKLSSKYFADAVKDTYGESPSGRYNVEVKKNSEGYYYADMVDNQAVAHAGTTRYRFALKQDDIGRIIGMGDPITDEIQHDGMMDEDEFLEHFGVKGMQWGKRKASSSSPAHVSADAARVKKIENRAKNKGLENLSNDDIAKLNKRKQLLNEYNKAHPNKMDQGYAAAKKAVAVIGTATALITVGTKVAQNPLVRKGAAATAAAIKNLMNNPAAAQTVIKAITS